MSKSLFISLLLLMGCEGGKDNAKVDDSRNIIEIKNASENLEAKPAQPTKPDDQTKKMSSSNATQVIEDYELTIAYLTAANPLPKDKYAAAHEGIEIILSDLPLTGNTSQISYFQDGKEVAVEAGGNYPQFSGASNQLFSRIPILSTDLKPASWIFSDSSVEPNFSNSVPSFVSNEFQNDRPDLSNLGWQIPVENPDNLLDSIKYASEHILWFETPSKLFRLKRTGLNWQYLELQIDNRHYDHVIYENSSVHFVYNEGKAISYYINKESEKKEIQLPEGSTASTFLYLPFASFDILITEEKTYSRRTDSTNWLPTEGKFKLPVVQPKHLVRFGDDILFVRDQEAYRYSIKTEIIIVEADDISADSKSDSGDGDGDSGDGGGTADEGNGDNGGNAQVGDEPTEPVVPANVIDITDPSCTECHNQVTGSDTYLQGNLFEPNNYKHWVQLVSGMGAGDAKVKIDTMCGFGSSSTCKNQNDATHVENLNILKSFIDTIVQGE